jgi:hypothetical protein
MKDDISTTDEDRKTQLCGCSLDIICALLTSPSTRYKALQQFITQCCFADVVEMLNDYLCGASSKPFDIESDLEMLSSHFVYYLLCCW